MDGLEWIRLFMGFLISNLLGYGGGPASIPLMYEEIVNHYGWLSDSQFSNMLALGNALPGPIATKIAAYVGFAAAGWIGLFIALAATVLPSAIALILLLQLLQRFRTSNAVKGITLLVQPVIAIMMVTLTWQIASSSFSQIGVWQALIIAAAAFWLMQRKKVHPALVIVGAFAYGGIAIGVFHL
ncbi:chromate transporter [Paenibacillus nasutitermitis]|uniref:Transporter YwrA n=1 Tax=Paenibacillus nasutitermitis TaxID=1652958 RepID=A0A917DU78_9BACL|nr:chromate transporter [Paenibacillus nasutitermitis]GGD67221.1 putative transporter YwrA [Paenibacillus nasutitermitis]